MRAIRIIRRESVPQIDAENIQRIDEDMRVVAQKIWNAASKITNDESAEDIDRTLHFVSESIHQTFDPISIHKDIEMRRILELLQD